ncbi:MAG: TlpA family protein disulfide reductase, partial [Bdellovibrionales bacterium]|nr:TlpA family protein disulfide reductase [Bdellovibrionales bacterium]
KVVYLDFWASWCAPCKLSFPWMEKMQTKYKDKGFVVVTINLDSEKKDAATFLKPFKVNFVVEYDPEGKLAEAYSVEAMPTSVVFDRNGKKVSTHLGFDTVKAEKYEKEIKSLLTK